MNIHKNKLKLRVVQKRLACSTNDKLSSIINRFPNSHTPLFAYNDNEEFMGLLTVFNTLFKQSHNPSTLIHSCLINPPKLLISTPVNEVLRLMSSLKLYTLPVFNDRENIIGVAKAKTMLKDLMKNQIFAETMIKNVLKKTVITIPENSNIGDAFQIFSKHTISRLVVVDKNNIVKGVVTKRDILSSYLAPTKRQRFSSSSHQKNYSFDIEQIKRDHQPLMNYISPILNVLDEKIDTCEAIHNLLDSPYNSIILVDKERKPRFIITTKDVLKTAVRITTKTPYLLTIVSMLPEEISTAEKKELNKELGKIASWFNKQQKVQLVRLTSKTVFSPEREPTLFIVNLKIKTDTANYFAQNKNRDFMEAFREVGNQIRKQLRRTN